MRHQYLSKAIACQKLLFDYLVSKNHILVFAPALSLICILLMTTSVVAQNVNVNPGAGSYPTLKDAFDAINLGTHTGIITVDIVGNTTETAPAVLNASGSGSASYTTIAIQPSGGSARTISGAIVAGSPLIDLNGADNVTIDGLNTGGNALTISNTTVSPVTGTSTIRFIGDASNNTIQKCTIQGSTTSSSSPAASGVVFFSTGASTGNDGNNINNCNITAAGANLPINGIYSLGTSAAVDNSGNSLNQNNISDYFNAGNPSQGINLAGTGNAAWTITNNKLFQTANRIYNVSNTHNAILIGVGGGYTISGNIIGFANAAGTGTTNLIGVSAGAFGGTFPSAYTINGATLISLKYVAINCTFTAGAAVSEIQNNTIAGFALISLSGASTTTGIWCAINVNNGNANIGTTTGNTIGATSGNGSIYVANTSGGGTAVGMYLNTGNTITVQNNTIGGVDAMGTTSTLSGAFTGIDAAGAGGVYSIANNIIGSTTANNIRTGNLVTGTDLSNVGTTFQSTTGTTSPMVGIRSTATGNTLAISGNTFRGWATSCTGAQTINGITTSGTMTGATPSVIVNGNFLGTATRDWMTYTVANIGTLTGLSVANTVATTYSIQTNDIRGITYNVAGTGAHTYITLAGATAANAIATIAANTFTNLNVNTSGAIVFISHNYVIAGTGQMIINNNSIVSAYVRGASTSSSLILTTTNATSGNGSVNNYTNNNFSNITISGVGSITGFNNTDGGNGSTKTISGNTFNNWTAGSGAINVMNITYWNGVSSVSNNVITNITGQGLITAVNLGSTSNLATSITISSNTINNLTSTGTGGNVTGIVCSNTSSGISFTGNVINTLSSTGASSTINGLTISGSSSPSILKNKIYDLSGNQAGTLVNGINISTGSTLTIANNLIGDLRATASTGLNAINGINASATATYNVYFNTIYLNATSSSMTSFGNSCITFSSSATSFNSRNNILVNLSTPAQNGSNVAVNGIAACLRRSGGTNGTVPANYATSSNNNLYWVNPTAGTNNHLTYGEGTGTVTNPMNTFVQFKTFLVNRDQLSATENPTFLSTTGSSAMFLHIDPTIPTQIEGSAMTISGITDDYDGDVRNVTTPDIGADEGNFIFADLTAPGIAYTILANTACTLDRTLASTITDASGINIVPGTKPRLYFKKSTEANTYAGNTSADNGWKYVEASNASSPFSFTTDYSLLTSPIAVNNVIQYFVVAQDLAGTPNVGINSGIFNSLPPSVALVAGNFPLTGTINSYTIVTPGLTGTVTIGASGMYSSLTEAAGLFLDINTKGLSGNLVAQIIDPALTENGTNMLNPIVATGCSGGPFTLTIKPNVVATISGSNAGAILRLNGADNVTIDGSIGTTSNTVCPASAASRDLTITNNNTGTSSAVVWLQTNGTDGATNNTIKNCIITGNANTTTLFGIGSGSSTIGTLSLGTGNNNNAFINNSLSKTQYGIYTQGASITNKNTGTIINQNLINAASPNNVGRGGIWTGFENNILVSANRIENMTSASDLFAISLGIGSSISNTVTTGNEVTNVTVTKNIINNISNTGTNSSVGIMLAAAATGTNLLANNMIGGVSANGTVSDFCAGILLGGGTGSTTNVYYNSIDMNGTITGATAGTTQSFALAVTNTTAPTLDIRNNILVNDQLPNAGGTTKFYAIGLAYSSTAGNYSGLTSNNNDLFAIAGANYALGITGGLSAGTVRATLAAWQTETGRDGASVNFLPGFITPTNLHIDIANAVNTPLDNGAVTVSVTDDIDCELRATDIGADEFIISSCSGALGGTASVTGPSAFCTSGTPVITASGYSTGNGSGYQWMSSTAVNDYPVNGTPIVNQTNPASMTTGPVSTTTYFWLKVTCTSGMGTAYSTMVTITIFAPPSATISPAGTVNLCPPVTSQLLTAATGASSPSYIWKKDGVTIGGATNATYSATVNGNYTVVITDGTTMCSTTSTATTVVFGVQPNQPVVTPSSATICSGDPAVLLTASGSGGGAGTATQSSGTISLAIPDNLSSGVSHTLTIGSVPVDAMIDSVIVTFNITHAFSADVEVNLEAPNGQIINLEADQGSTSALGFVDTKATSNTSAQAFSSGTSPFTGTFKADATAQTTLIGSPAVTTQTFANLFSVISGAWKIRAYDDFAQDVGTLVNWSIKISYHQPSVTYTWSPSGPGSGLYTNSAATNVYNGEPSSIVYALPVSSTIYTVTATNAAGCTNTKTVSVTSLALPEAGVVDGMTPLCVGVSDMYTATGGDPGGMWTSSNPSVASVNATTGVVLALAPGMTDIQYSVSNSCGDPAFDAKTLTVNAIEVANANDSGDGTLRDIIACAGPGATITFSTDLLDATILLTGGEIEINKNLTLTGLGALHLAVSGNNASRIFHVLPGYTLTLQGMTLKDATAVINGGAILSEGNVTLNGVTLQNNFENGIEKSLTFLGNGMLEIIGNVDLLKN